MVFSSSAFLFLFMPVFFAVYYLLRGRTPKNVWLLAASLIFYAWGEPVYIVLMLISIFANWALGLAIGACREMSPVVAGPNDAFRERILLAVAVIFNIALIGFFKYQGFLARTLNALIPSAAIPDLELPLPIGISFYTLQALSYVIDVYRGEVPAQKDPLKLGMYISSFPQLVAGPIVRYKSIHDQIVNRAETLSGAADGLRLFIIGLAKKALLANTCAILADKMLGMGGQSIGAVGAWAGLFAFSFQIYFDFGGYSDMAIGLGRMMGFSYQKNFNYPYVSTSVTEFWRRWHISLSNFFKDYLYIPLGGSHCSKGRWVINLLVVWAVTGLWHGASWNFVLWGIYYGLLLAGEKLLWGPALKRAPRIVAHLYTIVVLVIGWPLFWIVDPRRLLSQWAAMLGIFGSTGASTLWELTAWEYWPVLLVCMLASTPVAPWIKIRLLSFVEGGDVRAAWQGVASYDELSSESLARLDGRASSIWRGHVLRAAQLAYNAVLVLLLIASIASIVSGSFNPFIYFQF